MPRISISGLLANTAALALLGLTGVALAGPILPADIAGDILGGLSSSSFSNAFIDTLSTLDLSSSSSSLPISGLLYAVYATVTTLVSGLSNVSSSASSVVELIGYVLASDLSATLVSLSSSTTQVPIIDGIDSSLSFAFNPSALNAGTTIPEPSAIAVVVTAVAGIATLLRRRKLRRSAG